VRPHSASGQPAVAEVKNTVENLMTPFAFIILLGNLQLITRAYQMGGSLWSTCPDSRNRTRTRSETVMGFVIRVISKFSAGTLAHALNRLCRVVSAADCHKIRHLLEIRLAANQPPKHTKHATKHAK
jgi:hypothetical protein